MNPYKYQEAKVKQSCDINKPNEQLINGAVNDKVNISDLGQYIQWDYDCKAE